MEVPFRDGPLSDASPQSRDREGAVDPHERDDVLEVRQTSLLRN